MSSQRFPFVFHEVNNDLRQYPPGGGRKTLVAGR
jgi:hypothetical protein